MAISDLFRLLRARETTARATVKARYLEMVQAAASDKSIDADDAAELLDAVHKTTAEFEADVRSARARTELRARIERARVARPKLAELEKRASEIEAAFAAAQEQFRLDVEALHAESAPLEAIVTLAAGAEAALVDTCPDNALLAQFKSVSREWADARERVRDLEGQLNEDQLHHDGKRLAARIEDAVRRERRETRTGWEQRVRDLGERLADPEGFLRRKIEPRLGAAQSELAKVERQRAQLERALLEA